MADKRFFRITRRNGDVSYGRRVKVSTTAAAYRAGWTPSDRAPIKIEAIPDVSDLPWSDVTEEFFSG